MKRTQRTATAKKQSRLRCRECWGARLTLCGDEMKRAAYNYVSFAYSFTSSNVLNAEVQWYFTSARDDSVHKYEWRCVPAGGAYSNAGNTRANERPRAPERILFVWQFGWGSRWFKCICFAFCVGWRYTCKSLHGLIYVQTYTHYTRPNIVQSAFGIFDGECIQFSGKCSIRKYSKMQMPVSNRNRNDIRWWWWWCVRQSAPGRATFACSFGYALDVWFRLHSIHDHRRRAHCIDFD